MTRLRKLASGAGWCGLFVLFAVSAGDAVRIEDREDTTMSDDPLALALAKMRERPYDHVGAVPLLERAATDPANDPELTLGSLAECHLYLQQYDKALAACDRLAVAKPDNGRAPYIRGLVYMRQGRKAEAEAELRLAVRRGETLARTLLSNGG